MARILVVDDRREVVAGLLRGLQRLGHEAVGAVGPDEALAIDICPALVICDLAMPGMDGPQLIDCLRQRWPGLRVVFMTGGARAEIYRRAQRRGPVFDKVELLRELPAVVAKELSAVSDDSPGGRYGGKA